MSNWTCRNCNGSGMRRSEERDAMVLCDCPRGESKRRFLKMSNAEKRKERRERKREKGVPS